MVMTKSTRRAALDHIITVVLDQDADGEIAQALEKHGVSSPADLCNLSKDDISQLWYLDDEGEERPLTRGRANLLRIVKFFKAWKASEGNPIQDDEWGLITADEFTEYRFSNDCDRRTEGLEPIDGSDKASMTTSNPQQGNILHEFRKGIKRDPTLFPKLTDTKQWDSWNRAAKAQARAQLVYEVFDPTYQPTTPDNKALFEEKKKYMYAVFERCLLHIKGKALVREFETTYDAHALYIKLLAYHTQSTTASLDSSEILAYITTIRLGDGTWRGNTESFIIHWLDELRKYESIIPSGAGLSEEQKRSTLENAVYPISELRAVKTQAQQNAVYSGQQLTFDQYYDLLTSAAQAYDRQFTVKERPRVRRVLEHDLYTAEYDCQPFYDEPPEAYDIHSSHQQSVRTRLLGDQWHRLGEDGQRIWKMLTPEQKAIILETPPIRNSYPGSPQRSRAPPYRPNPGNPSDNNKPLFASTHESTITEPAHTPDALDDPYTLPSSISAHLTKREGVHPAEPSRMLARPSSTSVSTSLTPPSDVVIDGHRYTRSVSTAHILYSVSRSNITPRGALVDRGANGGIAGNDVRVLAFTHRAVNIRGIDNHQVCDVPIVTCAGVIPTNHGDVIAIMHNYAYTATGRTIHSSIQLESFGHDVNERPSSLPGGLQRILTLEGYIIPLCIHHGLAYMTIRPYTDNEWSTLPHVFLTDETEWDPSVVDGAYTPVTADPPLLPNNTFDAFGDFTRHHVVATAYRPCHRPIHPNTTLTVSQSILTPKRPDYALYTRHLGWLPLDVIRRTFDATTQLAHIPMSNILRKTFQSPNPALNVLRRRESVATDTVYSDTPSIDGGETLAQIYVGVQSEVVDIYGIKTTSQFTRTLEDNIRHRGAPIKLISDHAAVETSNKVKDILRAYVIKDWQSEPYHQHQNRAERKYQDLKRMATTIMDRTGAPPYTWLLALLYVAFLLNRTANPSLNHRTPLEALDGVTPDISILLRFHFYEPVYYRVHEPTFPSQTREAKGRFVGFSENVGHAMTYKILSDETLRVLHRSEVRSAEGKLQSNKRADSNDTTPLPTKELGGDTPNDGEKTPTAAQDATTFKPIEILGSKFQFKYPESDESHTARVVRAVNDHRNNHNQDPERQKYLLTIDDGHQEDVMAYGDILSHIESPEDRMWKFKSIIGHTGPLGANHPSYKGSKWNVTVEWDNGERTEEPLSLIASDDPVTVAIYAGDNGLLDKDGWKRFRTTYRTHKKVFRSAALAKLRATRATPKYMYGYEIPRDYQHALRLDKQNGNTKWQDCTKLELEQLGKYEAFLDLGVDAPPPDKSYTLIRVHLIYAVKHDGRHKARLVADGHLTDIPVDSVYSGVVSLRGLRLVLFLAKLNGLPVWTTDIGNAYLEALTGERVYIKAGPEFGHLRGRTMVIHKALYGLRSSGLRWHEKFADCLRDLGFTQSKAEADIWMRPVGDKYEYVAVYVDDLAMALVDPQSFITALENQYGFKLKGTGPIKFHLGCDFFRDNDGTLCMSPKKYTEKVLNEYQRMFAKRPRLNSYSPIEHGDHPELDTSPFLDPDMTQQYQSLVGSLQWAVSLGRIDIATAVMTMSSFRAAPREGHLERVKRIITYLARMSQATIRFRTEQPDYSSLTHPIQEWQRTVYGDVREEVPLDAPPPRGKPVTLTHYVDANLYHDWNTGKSVTGVLHFINQTPIDWFTKKQATVETATYGSEFIAARTCIEQIIDLRNSLRYLGVPINGPSHMFGDNKAVVDSSTRIDAKLHKRHVALSFHFVRSIIASGVARFYHINGDINPANVLSKHWAYSGVWRVLQPILFWEGDTSTIPHDPQDQDDTNSHRDSLTSDPNGEITTRSTQYTSPDGSHIETGQTASTNIEPPKPIKPIVNPTSVVPSIGE